MSSFVKLQTLQLVNENDLLDDGDALLQRFFLYLAVACLLTNSRKGGHVLGTPHTKFFQNAGKRGLARRDVPLGPGHCHLHGT